MTKRIQTYTEASLKKAVKGVLGSKVYRALATSSLIGTQSNLAFLVRMAALKAFERSIKGTDVERVRQALKDLENLGELRYRNSKRKEENYVGRKRHTRATDDSEE